ncbi:integrase catalytic domain-containing protein [Trichonephila clavipes]|nr:integrase catalytic domain-containing protein [Trichonephila clavipes]
MQWGHCPGKDNPADLLSRGTSAVKLAQNELWWHGPPWLKLTPDHWQNRHRDILDSELCSEELEHRSSVHVAVTQQREALVDLNRFSSLKKLLKTTAWVFRFVNNARNICKSMDFYITADEIQNAEYFWLKCVQSEFYSAEILALKQNEQLRSSSEIKSLVPYLDENNLLRLTGRLLEADLCFGEKHPVILPRRCKFTELLVIREHERIGHCSVSATLTQLRKKYWIPKSRQLVKTMIRICLVCKKYSAKPADQLNGQLPRDRITQSPPFQVVGIDFTGTILVKDNQGTRKSYVSLFTCAVTRAVHLELVSDMSTKCFLLALWRFLARRGNCKVIYSDNARTFKAAERELAYFANILKDSEFQNFVADKGIHWKFIVERAPWWGGFYERLVKTINDPLRKILGRALLTFEELSTILSEVEVIVNHRPLTYVENDPGEPEPLTPAHFLELGYGDSKYPIHFIELIDATTAKESYKKRKTYRTLLLKQLWRRWKEQYLLQLKTANHFKTPSVHKNLKLNDVVLVEGNVKSKLLWELGIIKEIFIGRDDNGSQERAYSLANVTQFQCSTSPLSSCCRYFLDSNRRDHEDPPMTLTSTLCHPSQPIGTPSTQPLPRKRLFHSNKWDVPPEVLAIYTDGSKSEDGRAGSGIFISNYEEDNKFSIRNSAFCCVFRSEMIAIRKALGSTIFDKPDQVIFLYFFGFGPSKSVCFQWIPSHVGVYGNETADTLARNGCDFSEHKLCRANPFGNLLPT